MLTKFRIFSIMYLIFLAVLLLSVWTALGADVTFRWIPNTESDLAGYHLFQSELPGSHADANRVADIKLETLSDVSNPLFKLTGVDDGEHYWAMTAYDARGLESNYSDWVTTVVDTTPPKPPGNLRIVQ